MENFIFCVVILSEKGTSLAANLFVIYEHFDLTSNSLVTQGLKRKELVAAF